jgi:hypothetical protein
LFHLLYFVYSGVSFGIGVLRHALRGRAPEIEKQGQAPMATEANAGEPQAAASAAAKRAHP